MYIYILVILPVIGTSVTANLMQLPIDYDGPTSSSAISHIMVAGTQSSQPILHHLGILEFNQVSLLFRLAFVSANLFSF